MHLRDAHLRLMSVGAIQQRLLGSGHGDPVYIGPYLSGLSQALAALMTDNSRLISLKVQAAAVNWARTEARMNKRRLLTRPQWNCRLTLVPTVYRRQQAHVTTFYL
jgi:hypothetical protein